MNRGCSDVARYRISTADEPTQGAGATTIDRRVRAHHGLTAPIASPARAGFVLYVRTPSAIAFHAGYRTHGLELGGVVRFARYSMELPDIDVIDDSNGRRTDAVHDLDHDHCDRADTHARMVELAVMASLVYQPR